MIKGIGSSRVTVISKLALLSLSLLTPLLGGCFSMAITGHPVQVTARERSQVLVLRAWIADQWLQQSGGLLSALVFYPYDVFRSLGYAIVAPFDPVYDVRLGPLGAVLGVALPGVTLIPAVTHAPDIEGTWVVEAEVFDSLLEAAAEGQRQLNGSLRSSDVWSELWWFVDMCELRQRTAGEDAELARAPDRSYWFVHFDPERNR